MAVEVVEDREAGVRPELSRIPCRAVFLDAGGVLVLPSRDLVRVALAELGVACDASAVAPAHYRVVRKLEDDSAMGRAGGYLPALCEELGVPPARMRDAVDVLSRLADRDLSGEILWSEPAPHALETIDSLGRAGIAVVIVTNSDGHAAENLRDAGICQVTSGPGAIVAGVIDSGVLGSAKPDPALFRAALRQAHVDRSAVVHVGDMLSTDVAGAHAAGIVPVHLDPLRRCRAPGHRHIRALSGIWRHVAPPSHTAKRPPRPRRATQPHASPSDTTQLADRYRRRGERGAPSEKST
jgi:putative hydrolase of the HAD superfamily